MIEEFGKHFSCFYIAEDVKAGKPETEFRVAASKGHFQGQGWRVRKNGSRFWANVAMTAVTERQRVTCRLWRNHARASSGREDPGRLQRIPPGGKRRRGC